MNKKIVTIFLSLCIALSVCGCKNNKEEQTGPVFDGDISIYAYADTTINPLVTKHHTNAMAYSIIYSPLIKINSDLSTENVLLDSFTRSDDGLSYTFRLGNHKFSDSSVVTADNVIKSLDLIKKNPESCFYQVFDYISSYKALSDKEFSVKLSYPNTNIVTLLNFPIVKDEKSNIGSGPFKIVSITDETVKLTANENSPTIPSLKNVNIKIYPDKDVCEDAFSNNETDLINIDISNLAQFSSKDDIKTYSYVSDDFTFLGFNCEKELFADINVKKAIASLVDKDKLCQSILVGHAVKTATPFKAGSIYSHDYDYENNSEKALEYLTLSEYEFSDITFDILVNSDNLSAKNTAEYIANTLKEHGMNTNAVLLDKSTYLSRINSGEFDAFVGEITMPSNGDISFLLTEGNMFNFTSGAVNNALFAFNASTEISNKKDAASELNKAYLNTLPLISLYYKSNMLLVSDKYNASANVTACDIFEEINMWKLKK